jgi:23S rRNA pseudouridine2605 synthase
MLASGVYIDGRKTAPAKVRILREDAFSTDILITIHEGRNRQIRKMAEAVGHKVLRLKRVGYGPLSLENMKRGTWRELTQEEVRQLKEL